MNVLIADKFEESGIEGIRKLGVDIQYQPDLKGETLLAAARDLPADVLIVRSTTVTKDIIEGSNLALIVRAGAGYNTIDVNAASEKGILVANCPGKNSQAVAELAFGLMIACDRRIPNNVIDIHNGVWNKATYSKSRGLHGRTLGLIGMGKISQEMITRAKAFGMNVVAVSRWMTPEIAAALGIGRANDVYELAQLSDFVSVHVSLTPETRNLLDKKFFKAMRTPSILINTSRAEVINEDALLAALESKQIYAGLDVFAGEPESATGSYTGPLQHHPKVYLTHHIGASTEQAQQAVADETVKIVKEFILTGSVPNVVNVSKGEQSQFLIAVRHADRVGVLAYVLEVLRDEGINVQEMENVVLGGARAAIAQIAVDKNPSSDALLRIKSNPNVFDATCMAIQR